MTTPLTLDEALALSRTGDLWLFRGRSTADRAIQTLTNAPVNHVGMAVVLDDLPPLMWHAELGHALVDVWSGTSHRGVQLHDMRDAVTVWSLRYGQRAWLRQLDALITQPMEAALLETIARLDGMPFPSTTHLAGTWLKGRLPRTLPTLKTVKALPRQVLDLLRGTTQDKTEDLLPGIDTGPAARAGLETTYCAEVVAVTYQAMGLLGNKRDPSWYDPGRFWSGDDLDLVGDAILGPEIPVAAPVELPW